MKTHNKLKRKNQLANELPLFDFRGRIVAFPQSRTWAGIAVTKRCRLAPALAEAVAELAGLGERGAR